MVLQDTDIYIKQKTLSDSERSKVIFYIIIRSHYSSDHLKWSDEYVDPWLLHYFKLKNYVVYYVVNNSAISSKTQVSSQLSWN